jgi:hypothetical protein
MSFKQNIPYVANPLRAFVAVLLLLLCSPIGLSATYNFKVDGICYIILDNHCVKVSPADVNSTDYHGDIVIPEKVTYDGTEYTVTELAKSAFFQASIYSISLPSTITKIDNNAFGRCYGLRSIDLPESVTYLGQDVFANSGLQTVTSLGSLSGVPLETFSGCTNLTSVTLTDKQTSIGLRAFSGCTALKSIELPETLTGIGQYAFENCTALSNLELSESLNSIDRRAFYGCTSLETVALPEGVTAVPAYAFQSCSDCA